VTCRQGEGSHREAFGFIGSDFQPKIHDRKRQTTVIAIIDLTNGVTGRKELAIRYLSYGTQSIRNLRQQEERAYAPT
jgi:hypothetical protein